MSGLRFFWDGESPEDHFTCPSCGTQFGYDDIGRTIRELRNMWLRAGGRWFNPEFPYFIRQRHWNAWDQLNSSGLDYDVPDPRREEREFSIRIPAQSVRSDRELMVVGK